MKNSEAVKIISKIIVTNQNVLQDFKDRLDNDPLNALSDTTTELRAALIIKFGNKIVNDLCGTLCMTVPEVRAQLQKQINIDVNYLADFKTLRTLITLEVMGRLMDLLND